MPIFFGGQKGKKAEAGGLGEQFFSANAALRVGGIDFSKRKSLQGGKRAGQGKRHYFDPHFALQNALLVCRRRLVKFSLGVLGCWDVKSHDVRFYCVEMGKRKALSAVQSRAVWFPFAEKGKQKAVFDVQSHAVCFRCA